IQGADHDIAISPDGSHIVYRGGTMRGQAQLIVRALNDLEARPLAGTTGARNPFMSPDGRWVGFFTGTELKKVSITGGAAVSICKLSAAPRGASWGDDDTIVFGGVNRSGLQRVSASGGEPKPLTTPDATKGEAHLFPFVLPASQAVLFTVSTGTIDSSRVDVLDMKSGQTKTLVRGAHDAVYADSGHLVYAVAPLSGN